MIGVQVDKTGYTMVACLNSGLELIGTGKALGELLAAARTRPEVDATSAVVAVPAWYHDGQRAEIRDQVREAGVANVCLVNEPTAIALAYGDDQAARPQSPLVMTVSHSGAFDVTVLALRERSYEVLAANGIPELDLELIQDADRLFTAIEPLVDRALADAHMRKEHLDAIILGGASAILLPVAAQIEGAWGRKPVEPPTPEIAMANGAALFGRLIRTAPQLPSPEPAPTPKSGCMALFALVVVGSLIPFFLD